MLQKQFRFVVRSLLIFSSSLTSRSHREYRARIFTWANSVLRTSRHWCGFKTLTLDSVPWFDRWFLGEISNNGNGHGERPRTNSVSSFNYRCRGEILRRCLRTRWLSKSEVSMTLVWTMTAVCRNLSGSWKGFGVDRHVLGWLAGWLAVCLLLTCLLAWMAGRSSIRRLDGSARRRSDDGINYFEPTHKNKGPLNKVHCCHMQSLPLRQ